jgi:hypothetical protein
MMRRPPITLHLPKHHSILIELDNGDQILVSNHDSEYAPANEPWDRVRVYTEEAGEAKLVFTGTPDLTWEQRIALQKDIADAQPGDRIKPPPGGVDFDEILVARSEPYSIDPILKDLPFVEATEPLKYERNEPLPEVPEHEGTIPVSNLSLTPPASSLGLGISPLDLILARAVAPGPTAAEEIIRSAAATYPAAAPAPTPTSYAPSSAVTGASEAPQTITLPPPQYRAMDKAPRDGSYVMLSPDGVQEPVAARWSSSLGRQFWVDETERANRIRTRGVQPVSYNGSAITKHPNGRARGEALPGATALVTHAKRQDNPFLLAQTKPLRANLRQLIEKGTALGVQFTYEDKPVRQMTDKELMLARQSLEAQLSYADVNNFRGNAKVSLLTRSAYDQQVKDFYGLVGSLPPEPAASKVNAPAATESSVPKTTSATLRLGVSRSGLVVVLPTDVANDIGRLGRPKIIFKKLNENSDDPKQIMISFPSEPKGYNWSRYGHKTSDDTYRRITIVPNLVKLPRGAKDFALQECAVWEYDEQNKQLVVVMPAELKTAKTYTKSKKGMKRSPSEQPPVEERSVRHDNLSPDPAEALEQLADAPPQSLDEVTHPLMPEQVVARQPVIDDEPQPAPIISPAEVQTIHDTIVAAGLDTPQAPVTLTAHEIQDLRDCLGVLNNLRQVYGRAIQFSLDTTTGKIGAKVVAEIQI